MTVSTQDAAAPERAAAIGVRAREHYLAALRAVQVRTDRLFAILFVIQWLGLIAVAVITSPSEWAPHGGPPVPSLLAALLGGGLLAGLPVLAVLTRPGAALTRHLVAACQMLCSVLLVHLLAGHTQAYFHVFVSLAFLSLYRDSAVLVTACMAISGGSFLLAQVSPVSVYGVVDSPWWRSGEHAGWMLFEAVVLAASTRAKRGDMRAAGLQLAELEDSRREVAQQVLDRTRALTASEERYRMLAASAPIGIFETDAAGMCLYTNPRWCELSGLTEAESQGDRWSQIVHPEDREGLIAARNAKVSAAEPFQHFYRIVRPDQEPIWVSVRAAPLRDTSGAVTGYVGTIEDISIHKRVEAELIRAREAALETARLKSEFLANMSHEIRTPMNGIIGMTDLALPRAHDDEQREYLQAVRSSADALLRVINDILDFSKIEAGKMAFESVPFSLRDLLQSTLHPMVLRAREKSLELALEIAPDVPPGVLGDPGRLRQVVLNLVGNALKFTQSGRVALGVRVVAAPQGGTSTPAPHTVAVEFSVSDTGIGIPADKQALIFEAFTQADGSTTRQFGGTGLGLAISSRIVGLMGGRIEVESRPGAGSTFRFMLPFVVPDDDELALPAPASAHANRAPAAGTRPGSGVFPPRATGADSLNVLLAEDQAVNRLLATRILQMLGHQVTAVEDGREVLQALEASTPERRFDLLLLDISMPELDGFETTAAIRSAEQSGTAAWSGRLPIVALTAHAMVGDRERCLAAGMNGYASKPFKPAELVTAMNEARAACGQLRTDDARAA